MSLVAVEAAQEDLEPARGIAYLLAQLTQSQSVLAVRGRFTPQAMRPLAMHLFLETRLMKLVLLAVDMVAHGVPFQMAQTVDQVEVQALMVIWD
jgi:hypothetical protein